MKRFVIITGATSGIGYAVTKQLLAEHHTVLALVRRRDALRDLSGDLHILEADLAQLDTLAGLCKKILQRYPSADALISCAGKGLFQNLEEFSLAQINDMTNINMSSPIILIRHLISHFKRKDLADIIHIGSEAALLGAKKASIYCATKFAMRGFFQSLRAECASSPVRISLIHPGMVDTAFYAHLYFQPGQHPLQHLKADDVAQAVSLVLNARAGTVFDEIHLTPHKKVIEFKDK